MPCPAVVIDDEQALCPQVTVEEAKRMEPMARNALGFDCSMPDPAENEGRDHSVHGTE